MAGERANAEDVIVQVAATVASGILAAVFDRKWLDASDATLDHAMTRTAVVSVQLAQRIVAESARAVVSPGAGR
jgi:hypothetical protein